MNGSRRPVPCPRFDSVIGNWWSGAAVGIDYSADELRCCRFPAVVPAGMTRIGWGRLAPSAAAQHCRSGWPFAPRYPKKCGLPSPGYAGRFNIHSRSPRCRNPAVISSRAQYPNGPSRFPDDQRACSPVRPVSCYSELYPQEV